jgi:carbon-monoxide dehydrogenase medium subunit
MKPAPFEYHAPASLAEALTLLAELDDDEPKVLAGGQSLVPAMNLRLARPTSLIDLNRITDLAGIERQDGEWRIGAMTRHAEVEDSAVLRSELPLLPEVVGHIGYRPIRNRGTVGGSLCHADPSAEWPLLARLLRAELDVRSASGARTIPADEFFEGVFTTTLREDEILTAIRFPAPAGTWRWGFSEFARKAGDFAVVTVGTLLHLTDGVVAAANVVAAGVGPTATRLDEAEAALTGAPATDSDARARAAAAAAEEVDPSDDVHGPGAFKRKVLATLVERTLAQNRGGDGGAS